MTNLPTNLVPMLLRIINDNARGTIMHDSADVRAMRDMLVIHGGIEYVEPTGCAGYFVAVGNEPLARCAYCGRCDGVDENDRCPDCQENARRVAYGDCSGPSGCDDDCAECDEYGDCPDCDECGWCQ